MNRRQRASSVDRLRRTRPRSTALRASCIAIAALVAYAWLCGDVEVGDLFTERRLDNLRRFLGTEIVPFSMRGKPWSFSAFFAWFGELFRAHGYEGARTTLATSVLAISLAGIAALCLMPFAARNLASAEPFAPAAEIDRASVDRVSAAARARKNAWRLLTTATRAFLIVLRAIPEYVWAFLLLAMLGPSAWPAVLALAIHNAGILGKLGAETIENLDSSPLRALRVLGGRRAQIGILAALPLALARLLLYFFYRFETCVREATVLGMLGVVSLGYWIQDARSKHFYDEMLVYVVLGAAIVLLGDLVSAAARAFVRRAT